jgi:uncharacterized protein (TIGR03083 family)
VDSRAPTRATLDDVEGFATAAEAFARMLSSADLRADVPSCPGWRVYDLAVHLGNEHGWAATVVETGIRAAEQHDAPPSRRRAKAVARWYAGKAEDLHEVLRGGDPSATCWNFASGSGPTRFWSRRQWHETTMHTVDLAQATSTASPLEPEPSADGVDETLRVFLPWMAARGRPADLPAPVALVASDLGRRWDLLPDDPSPRVALGLTTASSRVEAPAALLFQLLWRRVSPEHPDVTYGGDPGPVRRFLAGPLTP